MLVKAWLVKEWPATDWINQAATDCSLGNVIVVGSLVWGMIQAGPSGRVESQWYDTGFVFVCYQGG
jgi:hypothetical protein